MWLTWIHQQQTQSITLHTPISSVFFQLSFRSFIPIFPAFSPWQIKRASILALIKWLPFLSSLVSFPLLQIVVYMVVHTHTHTYIHQIHSGPPATNKILQQYMLSFHLTTSSRKDLLSVDRWIVFIVVLVRYCCKCAVIYLASIVEIIQQSIDRVLYSYK